MPKFMINGSYSTEGSKGVVADGGSSRAAVVSSLAESVGGSVEAFYFSFGGEDVVAIV
ncbi:MAG: GYD domain-containing protein, partial [Acidimicrobiia bacterium]